VYAKLSLASTQLEPSRDSDGASRADRVQSSPRVGSVPEVGEDSVVVRELEMVVRYDAQ
jgi:hypothetical protein